MPFPKPVRRLDEKATQRREAAAAWVRCCSTVDRRDEYRCRCCGRRVRKTFDVCAERAEHHHLTPRSLAPGLTCDSRNVLLVCSVDHDRLTRHEIDIRPDRYFAHAGRLYPDADYPIEFGGSH